MKHKLIFVVIITIYSSLTTLGANPLFQSDSLSNKNKSFVAIAATAAKGDLSRLRVELNKGLDAGLTVNETKEALIHLYAYAGFPRSIRGLQTLMTVVDERKGLQINGPLGVEASIINEERGKYERGKEILEQLTGVPENDIKTGYAAFAPTIEVFLKEHLFADIFERDILTYAERELVTISVLASIGGVEPMLKSHLNICLNVGITEKQLREFITIIDVKLGKSEAETAQIVLDEVLASRNID